jgi:hypothetical protein
MTRRSAALGVLMLALSAGPVAAVTPLADEDLADMRGGYINAAGIAFDFAADMKTFVDGELALQTTLSSATGMLGTSQQVTLPGGMTTIMHRIDDGQLSNILINSASNQDFRQELNVTLTLPGFLETQRGFESLRIGRDLTEQIGVLRGLR